MIFDALKTTLRGDQLPQSKGDMFSAAAGGTSIALSRGRTALFVEALEFCGLPLNKLGDGSRSSQEALMNFNLELAQRVAAAAGATTVTSNKATLKAARGSKKCLVSDVDLTSSSPLCFVAPASSTDWRVVRQAKESNPRRVVIVVNGVRNTMPLDGSMDDFEYAYYLRRLTYGLLLSTGVGRDWKSFLDYRQGKPTYADSYGPTQPTIVEVSSDLQGRAGFMKMRG